MRRILSAASSLAVVLALILPGTARAFSTDGKCLGLMAQTATIEVGPGFWTEETPTISVRYVDPMFDWDESMPPVTFTVDGGAPIYSGQVRLDQDGLFWGNEFIADQAINPGQDTVLWAAWFFDMTGEIFGGPPVTMQEVRADAEQAWIAFSVDGGEWVKAWMSPYRSVCANGQLSGSVESPILHRTWGPSE